MNFDYNKNIDSTVNNIKIGNKNIADKRLEGLDVEILNMSKSDKINYLPKIADKDLGKLIEKMRAEWIDEKFTGALNLESEKYDTAKQSENILNHLKLNVDGESVGIYEFVDNSSMFSNRTNVRDSVYFVSFIPALYLMDNSSLIWLNPGFSKPCKTTILGVLQ